MELIETNNSNDRTASQIRSDAYLRAQRKVENLKGFYIHLLVYLIINSVFSYINITKNIADGETFREAFFTEDNFGLWLLWGIGLALHGVNVFVTNGTLGQKWEERKIKQYMNEDDNRTWK